MYEHFTIKILLRWRLLLEECVPAIKYIKGTDNVTLDDLIKIALINSDITERIIQVFFWMESIV